MIVEAAVSVPRLLIFRYREYQFFNVRSKAHLDAQFPAVALQNKESWGEAMKYIRKTPATETNISQYRWAYISPSYDIVLCKTTSMPKVEEMPGLRTLAILLQDFWTNYYQWNRDVRTIDAPVRYYDNYFKDCKVLVERLQGLPELTELIIVRDDNVLPIKRNFFADQKFVGESSYYHSSKYHDSVVLPRIHYHEHVAAEELVPHHFGSFDAPNDEVERILEDCIEVQGASHHWVERTSEDILETYVQLMEKVVKKECPGLKLPKVTIVYNRWKEHGFH